MTPMRKTNATPAAELQPSERHRGGRVLKLNPLARLQSRTVEKVAEAQLPTELGAFRIIGYRSLISQEEFVVLALGEMRTDQPTLVRIHSQCLTGDVFGSLKCDCGQQLRAAM